MKDLLVYFSLFAAKNYQMTNDQNHNISCSKNAADIIIAQPNPETVLLAALNKCGWNIPKACDVQNVLTHND